MQYRQKASGFFSFGENVGYEKGHYVLYYNTNYLYK
jgi:hypothetical protein